MSFPFSAAIEITAFAMASHWAPGFRRFCVGERAVFGHFRAAPEGSPGRGREQAAERKGKKKSQTACKPGSVPACAGDGHSSGTPVTGRLARPTRAAARKPDCRRNSGVPPLLGLAPGGVYPATPVAGGAVRSYRTLSPLPRLKTAGDRRSRFYRRSGRFCGGAVCFLWHFP